MASENGESPVRDVPRLSRRTLLAASGVVALGGLSGCLNQVTSSVTNTGASPGAVFAGERADWNDDETEVTVGAGVTSGASLGEPRVRRLTPTLSGGGISGSVELEGWVTSVSVSTEDYNSPRSNRSRSRPGDLIGDDADDRDETFETVSRLDAQLQTATDAAVTAISKRSARTGRNPDLDREVSGALDEMGERLSELRSVLERCSDESCVAPLENVGHRESDLDRARDHVENGEWAAFGLDGGGDGDDIIVGDYLLHAPAFDPTGSFSAGERAALARYLGTEPVVGERLTVCVPDAEVPGGNGSLRDELTPERLLDYVAGRADSDDKLYSWGKNNLEAAPDSGSDDCDDGDVCGSPHLTAAVSAPTATGGGLEAVRASDGTVTVLNTPPSATDGPSMLAVPVDGEPYEPDGLDAWGKRADAPPMTMDAQGRIVDVTVVQGQVQPPGCPEPVPALVYVSRGVSDDQLIYSGGWVIDDAALYADASTVLTMAGAAKVVGVECCLDYSADYISGLVSGERARRGARIDSGPADSLAEAGVLSEGGREGVDTLVRKRPGRTTQADGSDDIFVAHIALDAPVLHLVDAGDASNEVKFKAGAELSKSVN
jgi:hypothetical protein